MSTISLTQLDRVKSFAGWQETYSHMSVSCNCPMTFSIYLPPQVENSPAPVLTWLSGLTCTHENFVTKAGAQQFAARHGIIIVVPDTSPRGAGIEGEDDDWDFGTGAGFYLNATRMPWSETYNMYDYVVKELPDLIHTHFPTRPDRESIFGHSMGGHGALTIALKNPGRFRSVSAFAPICAPSQSPWGQKAFTGYLGNDRNEWLSYDALHLIQHDTTKLPILIDQGAEDSFLSEQLHFDAFVGACERLNYPIIARMQPGYDHSYYFIASFMHEHIVHHASALLD